MNIATAKTKIEINVNARKFCVKDELQGSTSSMGEDQICCNATQYDFNLVTVECSVCDRKSDLRDR